MPLKLLLLQFTVSDMSVELQSQGKSVAELQVTGVRAALTKRPFDTNIAMSVHSLLLVDALQVLNHIQHGCNRTRILHFYFRRLSDPTLSCLWPPTAT